MELDVDKNSERLLIFTPFGKDAQHLTKVLGTHGFQFKICQNLSELAHEVESGGSAILTTEEALAQKQVTLFISELKSQPTWSAIPLLVFYTPRDEQELIQRKIADPITAISDINYLQRPVSTLALVSAVRSAVRDRKRQYRTRDLLLQLREDITRKEKVEKDLIKANAGAEEARLIAETANQSKSQFLANMSHEIRTPLGAIVGYAELMSRSESTRAEVNQYISVIRRNSEQLLRIIDDILDLSKVDAGKLVIEKVNVRLLDVLYDLTSSFELRSNENGVQFRLDIKTPLPETVISDPIRLKQILLNVVGNAIKFSPHGTVELNISLSQNLLSFEVRDTGRGISPEQQTLLFQPFTQADASITRKFGGTGLGLVLTKRLCQQMGGDFILKESALDKGSVFIASVRIEEVTSKVLEAPLSLSIPSNEDPTPLLGLRILVAEDSPDNQELLRIHLSKAGAKVDIASNGLEGVEKALNGFYSAIVMDIQMPIMDGIEAVRILREKGLTLPIVALSAHAMKEEKARGISAGFTRFLSKPVHRESLLQVLTDVCRTDSHALNSSRELEDSQPFSVLIVEDDSDVVALHRMILSDDYDVNIALSAEEALAFLSSHKLPHLILLDLTLPGMSGMEFMEILNARKDRNDLSVIITSGRDDIAEKSQAIKANAYLQKPIGLTNLRDSVKSLCSNSVMMKKNKLHKGVSHLSNF